MTVAAATGLTPSLAGADPASAPTAPTATTGAVSSAPYDDAGYWRFADRMLERLDATWNSRQDIYESGGGGAASMVNASLLLTHAVAALRDHEGPARRDARARAIARRLVTAPAYVTRPTGRSSQRHAPGWNSGLHGTGDQHLVYDAEILDALAYAYRARHALHLPDSTVALIRDRVGRVATGSFWRYPTLRLNQINWYVLAYAANATVNGRRAALARGTRGQISKLIAGARPARAGAAGNFGPGLRFHYLPDSRPQHPMNVDSAEYANIVLGFSRFYDQARSAGMPAPPASQRAFLRRWVRRALSGYWTHGGYLNWDSGLGFDRWHQGKKHGLDQQALIGIAATRALQPNASYGRWAKYVLDRGFELYGRFWQRRGGLPPATYFGLTAKPQGLGSARLTAARMVSNAARALDAGLGHRSASEPPALYSYDPDIGRLAITTPRYNTAIVAVNQGAFPYGGVELARLFDRDQNVAANIGGRPPVAFGLLVRNASGRQLMATQLGRRNPTRSTPPLRLTTAPRGVRARTTSVGGVYAGPFSRLRAVGSSSRGGFRATTSHRFTPASIDTRWRLRSSSAKRVSVDALFPSTGPHARIVAVLRNGSRVSVGARRLSLARVARFEVSSRYGGYTVTPLSRPKGAAAHRIATSRQSSAPQAGPTLAIQIRRGQRVGSAGFGARIRVR